jgi:hypothetical protein
MTIDDARWMARLIGQLSEEQIVQALVASDMIPPRCGFTPRSWSIGATAW